MLLGMSAIINRLTFYFSVNLKIIIRKKNLLLVYKMHGHQLPSPDPRLSQQNRWWLARRFFAEISRKRTRKGNRKQGRGGSGRRASFYSFIRRAEEIEFFAIFLRTRFHAFLFFLRMEQENGAGSGFGTDLEQ